MGAVSRKPKLVILALTLMAGCGPGEPPASSSNAQIDTLPDGRVTVANERDGTWTEETRWALEEDLRIGSGALYRESPEQFSQIAYILTHQDGRIYVLDYPTQEIRVFSADGDFLYQIGRRGDGPGELQRAAGLDWGPDGNLWVWGLRYSIFEPGGSFVSSYQRRVLGFVYPWTGGFVPGGTYVDWGMRQDYSSRAEVDQYQVKAFTGRTLFYPIAFTPPDGLDTLATFVFQAEVATDGQLKIPSQRLVVGQADDGYLWVANSDEYAVFKTTLAGDTLLSFTLPSSPLPVTDHEIDSTLALYAGLRGPLPTPTRETFASFHRTVTLILPDNAGHVYVFPQEKDLPEGSAVDVFEESGVYLGRMNFPERVRVQNPPPHVTQNYVYAVRLDELDVPYLVRLRIVRP